MNPTTRHTVFSVIIGGFFYWASLLCVNQSSVQKAMSLRNLSKAKIAMTLSVVGLALVFLMNFYTGLMTFAKYGSCDPMKTGQIDAIDQLMPFYVMDTFGSYTSFVGIFVAGIFAASLGTVAACLSSLSAVTIEDLMVCGLNVKMTSAKKTFYAKCMNFGYGIMSFGLIFLVEGRGVLQATLTLNGLIGGILLGLFSLGIFFKKANLKGALYGGLLATICVLILGVFSFIYNVDQPFLDTSTESCDCEVDTPPEAASPADADNAWYQSLIKVSYLWYSMIGTLLTVALGLLISCLTQCYDDRKIRKICSQQTLQPDCNVSGQLPRNSVMTVARRMSTATENRYFDWIVFSDSQPQQTRVFHISTDEAPQTGDERSREPELFGIDNRAMFSDENDRRSRDI